MGDFVDTALALLEAVEPDAEGYECESCGERAVMGAEQVLLCHGGF